MFPSQSIIPQTLLFMTCNMPLYSKWMNQTWLRIRGSIAAVLTTARLSVVIWYPGNNCLMVWLQQLSTSFFISFYLEILPDCQPHVGHWKFRKMGGCSPGKTLHLCECLVLYVLVCASVHLLIITTDCLLSPSLINRSFCKCLCVVMENGFDSTYY